MSQQVNDELLKKDEIDYEIELGGESEEDLNANIDDFLQIVVRPLDWTVETLMSQISKGNINFSPDFQRRNAWGHKAKCKFIESLFLELPIPQIILAESTIDEKFSYIVIDGKQRLLAIKEFYGYKNDNGEKIFLKLSGLKIFKELNGKTIEDLNKDPSLIVNMAKFENLSIKTVVVLKPSKTKNEEMQDVYFEDREKYLYTIFLRLNTGSLKLSPQELRQALHPGEFVRFADEFALNLDDIWKSLSLPVGYKRRMKDTELIIRYFAFKYFMPGYDGNVKIFLDNACQKLNKAWKLDEQEIRNKSEQLVKAIDMVRYIFDKDSFKKFVKGDENREGKFSSSFSMVIFDLMTYYFSIEKHRNKVNDKNKNKIKKLFTDLCKQKKFSDSISSLAKLKEQTIIRYNTWGEKLSNLLRVDMPKDVIEFKAKNEK